MRWDENKCALKLESSKKGRAHLPTQGPIYPPCWTEESRCKYCTYRSLCDRGTAAGIGDESDVELDLEIELAEVEEIAY